MIKVNADIREEIEKVAPKFGLDPDLVEAIVITESSGFPAARRYEPNFYAKYIRDGEYPKELKTQLATSYGLMQVMGVVAYEYGLHNNIKETLCTIEGGLWYGCMHFGRFLKKWGNVDDAIASYNAGSPRKQDGQYVNQRYVDKVKGYYEELKGGDVYAT